MGRLRGKEGRREEGRAGIRVLEVTGKEKPGVVFAQSQRPGEVGCQEAMEGEGLVTRKEKVEG